jgi:multisubunit Na+/H+ antiporter MnhB subunit
VRWIIRLEELALFLLSIIWYGSTGFAWYWFPLLLLAPDLAMVGYLAGARPGSYAYNLAHHRALAVALFAGGSAMGWPYLGAAGAILFGHASLDRVFGYGLKYGDSFRHTHLGWMGGGRESNAVERAQS